MVRTRNIFWLGIIFSFGMHECSRCSEPLVYGKEVQEYSPVVAGQEHQLEQACARKRKALLAFAPKVSLEATLQKRSAICLYPRHHLGLAVEQVLFDPAKTIFPYRKEKLLVQSQLGAYDVTLHETNNDALEYDITFASEKKNELSTLLLQSYAHMQYGYDEALYKSGLAIEPPVLLSKARTAESDTAYANTFLKQTAALVGFQSTIGDSAIQPFGYEREARGEGLDTFLHTYTPKKIVNKAVSNNPLMRQLWFSMQAALEDASAASWSYVPRAYLFFGCDSQRYDPICQSLAESLPLANWQGGIRIEWDFDGLGRIEDRSIAFSEYCKIASDRQVAIKDFEKAATTYHTTLTNLSASIADTKATLAAQTASYQERHAQYQAGLVIAVDVEKVRADMAQTQQKLDELLKQAALNYEAITLLSGYSLA